MGTASIKLYDAQSTTLTATQGSATGTSGSFTVNPAGASAFNVANPGTQTAGTAFSVTINALDAWGNAAPSYTGTQVLTFSGPANAPDGHGPGLPGLGQLHRAAWARPTSPSTTRPAPRSRPPRAR